MALDRLHALLKLGIPAMALIIAAPAYAVSVTFTTTGVFTCGACVGSGTNTVTYGTGADTLTLSFQGITNSTVMLVNTTPPSSNSSAGNILATVGPSLNGATITPTTFDLTVNQSSPQNGSGSLSGNVGGSIAFDSSNGTVEFTSTDLVLGGVTYTLRQQSEDANDVSGYDLEEPNTGGTTSLQMHIVAAEVPEPSFLALTGFGFMGLALIAFLRRQKSV